MIWFFEVRFEDMSRDVLLLISGAERQQGGLTCIYIPNRTASALLHCIKIRRAVVAVLCS